MHAKPQSLPASDREFGSWLAEQLHRPAEDVDRDWSDPADFAGLLDRVRSLDAKRREGDEDAYFAQQWILSKLQALYMQLPDGESAEGSYVVYAITRRLEQDTMAIEDEKIPASLYEEMPESGTEFVHWLKDRARNHGAYKHPYYHKFIHDNARPQDLRRYVIQESSVDSRFDDLLALMQVGVDGDAKMEIASNYWDEMGNGKPEEVHTLLFGKIVAHFGIEEWELQDSASADSLLQGNLAAITSRHRHLYGEAVGYLGMTEWLVPDRFSQVVHAWNRLGLDPVGIVYHDLHISVDAHHASGWFRNVIAPAAENRRLCAAMLRGAMWRLNSSERYLNANLAEAEARR